MYIFTRTACLGAWVTQEKFGKKHKYYNQQKVRVDLFMDFVNGVKSVPPMKANMSKWLRRVDMGGIYGQTERLDWLHVHVKPDLLIMDNYSELVDKRFEGDNWAFCGLYGEFKPEFINSLNDKGLLEDVEKAYDAFFKFVEKKWNIPIIFIHFPTTFDIREKYINQGNKITKALEILSKKYNIQNIHADPDKIVQRDCDYYHLADVTVKNMASKIK